MLVKRLQKELRDLNKDPIPKCIVKPLEQDIKQWRFVFKGEDDTVYKGGLYMGSIILPEKYPFAPPSIKIITPNGRFKPDTRICLSYSDWHPETWNPGLTVRTMILGLISFFYEETKTEGCVNAIDAKQRPYYAINSIQYNRTHKEYLDLFSDNHLEQDIHTEKETV